MELIGWILIGILSFYWIRNIWAGSFLYLVASNVRNRLELFIKQQFKGAKVLPPYQWQFRNYYLFILNPCWWSVIDVFQDKEFRKSFRETSRKVQKNLKNLQ